MKECDWMAKERIYEVAKELGIDNKVVVDKAKDLGFDVTNHMSSLEDSQVNQLKSSFRTPLPLIKSKRSLLRKIIRLRFRFLPLEKMRKNLKMIIKNIKRIIIEDVIIVIMIMLKETSVIMNKSRQLAIC